MRFRREDGVTTAEYAAVLVVVAAVIGVVAVSGVAAPMRSAIATAFCSITPSGVSVCSGPGGIPLDPADIPPPPDCTIATSSETINGSITIASADIGADVSYRITEKGDGAGDSTYEVELNFHGELGAKLQEGGKIEVGEGGLRSGKSVELEAGAGASITPVFSFDDEQDARDLVERTRELVEGPIDDTLDWKTLIPIYGPARIPVNQAERIMDYDPGTVDKTRIEGEVFVGGSASAFGGGAGGQADGRVAQALGAELDHQTGDTTIYYKVSAEVAASLGLQTVGASGGLDSELVAKVTMNDDFDLENLELGWTGTASAGASTIALDQLWFAQGTPMPADAAEALGVGLTGSDEQTWALEAKAEIDLTDPRLRDAGELFVEGLTSGELSTTVDGGGDLIDYMVNDSDLLVQYRHGDSSETGLDVSGGRILSFGFGGGYASDASNLQDAWYRPGGFDWQSGACGT